MLSGADDALYVAKRRGGGRICTAGKEASGAVPRLVPSVAGSPADRIGVASEEIIERLDGELGDAPVLDRLEAVAKGYAEAADFASWAISFAGNGTTFLRDLSVGENRLRQASGVRVASSALQYELYELDEFPATAAIIAAGTGSVVAHVGDPEADPAERQLLEEEGFQGIVGATAGDHDGVYLLELFADRTDAPLAEVEPALRMAVRAAIPPRRHRRDEDAPNTAHSRALELSLALADRLAEAQAEHEVCEAAVEEIQDAFGCPVVHVVAIEGERFKMRAERGPVRTRGGWSQRVDAGLIGRCLTRLRAGAQRRRGARAAVPLDRGDPRDALGARRPDPRRRQRLGSAQPRAHRRSRPSPRTTPACSSRSPPRSAARCSAIRPLREPRPRLHRHRRGALRRARGEGRLHRRALALDRRATPWRSAGSRDGRRRAADAPLRRRLPRHRQARDLARDPQQARPADRGRADRDRAAHRDRRADPRADRVPRPDPAARPQRPRALGRRRLPRRPRRRGDPARRPHPLRLRRLRRDDHRPSLPLGDAAVGGRARSCATVAAASSTRR